ncbi:MAG: acyltransferase family protein [Acidimicrobiia bacterium]
MTVWRQSADIAAATPPDRDRVVDLLRAGSLLVVVLGHVLMVIVRWQGDTPHVYNLLAEVPLLDLATWLLQVMPVFFAAGAIANRISYGSAQARGEPWRVWVWHRVRRLVRPVVYYLAAWAVIVPLLGALIPDAANTLARLSTQLLWFLGAYFLVIATTQWQIRLARHGFAPVVGLVALIALTDVARFHLIGGVGVVNFFTVWFMAATLGLVVRDRLADRTGRHVLALTAIGALAVNVVLVAATALPYPESMVGMPGEKISNMAPPTIVLALHAVILIRVVGLLWPALTRLCARPHVWRVVVAGGAAAMTVYLWHLTALLGVVEVEHLLGFHRGLVDGLDFWLGTVVHLVVALAAILLLVAVVVPFEHLPVPWLERPREHASDRAVWTVLAAFGVLVLGVGFLVLAATGMGGFPFDRVTSYAGLPLTPGVGFLLVAAGAVLTRTGGSHVRPGQPSELTGAG